MHAVCQYGTSVCRKASLVFNSGSGLDRAGKRDAGIVISGVIDRKE